LEVTINLSLAAVTAQPTIGMLPILRFGINQTAGILAYTTRAQLAVAPTISVFLLILLLWN